MVKKLLALVLAMGMVLSLFAGCHQGVPGSGGETEGTDATEKVYAGKWTMSDTFGPNGFDVYLTEEAAKKIDEYDVSDFPEVACQKVIKSKEGVLWIALETPGKLNVLEAMDAVAKRSDVLDVAPVVYGTFDDVA